MSHYVTLRWSASIFRSCGWIFQQWWEDVSLCLLVVTDSLEFLVCRSCWPKHAEAEITIWVLSIPASLSKVRIQMAQMGQVNSSPRFWLVRYVSSKTSKAERIEQLTDWIGCIYKHLQIAVWFTMHAMHPASPCWLGDVGHHRTCRSGQCQRRNQQGHPRGSHVGWPLPPWRKCGD